MTGREPGGQRQTCRNIRPLYCNLRPRYTFQTSKSISDQRRVTRLVPDTFVLRWPVETYQPLQDSPAKVFQNCFAFGSPHPGSFNMAFCDGSVHEIAYDIDMQVHRNQANRLDGD